MFEFCYQNGAVPLGDVPLRVNGAPLALRWFRGVASEV